MMHINRRSFLNGAGGVAARALTVSGALETMWPVVLGPDR